MYNTVERVDEVQRRSHRRLFLLQPHHKKVCRLDILNNVAHLHLTLQLCGPYAKICQFVAIDDTTASEKWLSQNHRAADAFLHQ